MKYLLMVQAHYACSPQKLFEKACCFRDMMDATRKISKYHDLPAEKMEEGRCYITDITLFGFLKSKDYHIKIEKLCKNSMTLVTEEHNSSIRSWKHYLEVRGEDRGALWLDHVELDAGLMTPVLASYARFMYSHRHAQRQASKIHTQLQRLKFDEDIGTNGKRSASLVD